jgi:ribonuclease-3
MMAWAGAAATTDTLLDMADHADTPRAAALATLGHPFHDDSLLIRALTHTSRLGAQASPARKRAEANERLEFLGDALLGAAVGLALFERLPDADEGRLSRLRSNLVSRAALAQAISGTALLAHARVGAMMGPQAAWPDSIKANLAEAVLAAVYLDAGFPALCAAVAVLLGPAMADPASEVEDARARLQAWSLERHKALPAYVWARTGGSEHQPEYTVTVTVGASTAQAVGSSRRKAEAAAALVLLGQLTAG